MEQLKVTQMEKEERTKLDNKNCIEEVIRERIRKRRPFFKILSEGNNHFTTSFWESFFPLYNLCYRSTTTFSTSCLLNCKKRGERKGLNDFLILTHPSFHPLHGVEGRWSTIKNDLRNDNNPSIQHPGAAAATTPLQSPPF